MQKFLVALALSLVAAVGAAQADPSAQAVDQYRFRIQVVERLTALEAFQKKDAQTQYKIAELERKVAGMQKQITVLHAKVKSVESEDSQIIERLTAACANVEKDVQRLKTASILTHQELNKLRKQ